MTSNLKDKWNRITPEAKRILVISACMGAVLLIGIFGYTTTRRSDLSGVGNRKETKKDIALEEGLYKKSLYRETKKELNRMSRDFNLLKAELEKIKKEKVLMKQSGQQPLSARDLSPLPQATPPLYSVPPAPSYPTERELSYEERKKEEQKPKIEMIGGIEVVSAPAGEFKKKERGGKKRNSVYLPPSFMEATLLSGLDAPTAETGSKNPAPVLLRIRNLAVLPNRVKANLKGCFVIGGGRGNLANHRAQIRLINLSCIAKDGTSVIDQQIKGFVVDEDGKLGLKGRVVSKMGSMLARTFLAGFVGGIGKIVESGSTTTSISALGTTQTVDSAELATAGIGGGLSASSRELQKFYLNLARQTLPVIEIGATKEVTLVISEGVKLKIQNYCIGGSVRCV